MHTVTSSIESWTVFHSIQAWSHTISVTWRLLHRVTNSTSLSRCLEDGGHRSTSRRKHTHYQCIKTWCTHENAGLLWQGVLTGQDSVTFHATSFTKWDTLWPVVYGFRNVKSDWYQVCVRACLCFKQLASQSNGWTHASDSNIPVEKKLTIRLTLKLLWIFLKCNHLVGWQLIN